MKKILTLVLLVTGLQMLSSETVFNVFRDEESTFVRYWNKAFIQNTDGWGLVFLNTEDYWNFFGMMDVENIIYGASWLTHKVPPLFVSYDGSYSNATVARMTVAYDFRNLLGFLTLQPGVSVAFSGQSLDQKIFSLYPQYADYLRYPSKKLALNFFLQYYVDTDILKSKLFYLFESVDNPVKNLYLDLLLKVKGVVNIGPVAEIRRGVEGANSWAEALQAGFLLEFPPWFKAEARHRAFKETLHPSGFSPELFQMAFKDPLDWLGKTELTLPLPVGMDNPLPLFLGFHWQARYGFGWEAGVDVGKMIMGFESQAMSWTVALGYNKISDDPLLQTPGKWSFVFQYFGDAAKF